MTWVTILFIAEKDDAEKFAKVIETLNYCVEHDKYRNFRYEVDDKGEGIRIFSPQRQQAFKRGSMFHKKFGIHYQVERG